MKAFLRMILQKRITFPTLLAFLALLGYPNDVEASKSTETFEGWTCNQLTPDLCDLNVHTGSLSVKGGIKVRYWKYSVRKGSKNPRKLPVIVLHGGPGFPHPYLLPLKKLACDSRDVIFYDQAGCGESTLPLNRSVQKDYPWLLDPAYYALDELPSLLTHLGVDGFHLLGHSWGTMLAQIYALDAATPDRQGLASMSLSGAISDLQLEAQQQWKPITGSLGTLPPFVQQRIQTLEADKSYESPEYQAINNVLTTFFTCRTAPLPDCYTLAAAGCNREIYVSMQGASEFTAAGVLADFNTTARLHELTDLPVLLMSGEYDTVRPAVVEVMHENLPLSERILFPQSAHVSAIDVPGPMYEAVADFLERVEVDMNFLPRRDQVVHQTMTWNLPSWSIVLHYFIVFIIGAVLGTFWGRRNRGYERLE